MLFEHNLTNNKGGIYVLLNFITATRSLAILLAEKGETERERERQREREEERVELGPDQVGKVGRECSRYRLMNFSLIG